MTPVVRYSWSLVPLGMNDSRLLTPRSNHPLTTNDAFWRRQFLAACYQLAQSVLKIGSALAERVGQREVCGCTALADTA